MSHTCRRDGIGKWQHLYHRRASRRTVFETRRDNRYFLAQLAKAVRRGELEIHAICLLTNHFHALVRSPVGRISHAMMRVLQAYVRYFNRTRGRDGSLFGNRFKSKVVDSLAYRRVLLRYIDHNPVEAGLVAVPEEFPWGSASWYAREAGPPWLERSWVESEVMRCARKEFYDPRDYAALGGRPVSGAVRDWVWRRLLGRASLSPADPLDDLLAAAPEALRRWMCERARVADGTEPGHSLVPAEWVEQTLGKASFREGPWRIVRGTRAVNAWNLALAGLLRDLAGLRHKELCLRLRLPRTTLQHRLQAHHELLQHQRKYADWCAMIARLCLDRLKEL